MPTQRQQISASIQANFPDNTSQFITPARLRTEQGLFENYAVLNEQTASIIAEAVTSASAGTGLVTTASFNAFTASTNTFTQSIQTQVNALQAATGSYITSAQTGSMSVLSASYASSSTSASYALTASYAQNAATFPYTGSAQITGSLGITGSIEATNQNGLVINLGSSNTAPNAGNNTNKLAFGNGITNNSSNNGFAFGDNHTIGSPGYNNFIAGGNGNTLNNNRGFAGGGISNIINAIDGATIGGNGNTIAAGHDGSIILGGSGIVTTDSNGVFLTKLFMMDPNTPTAPAITYGESGSNQLRVLGAGIEMNGGTFDFTASIGSPGGGNLRIFDGSYITLFPGANFYLPSGSSTSTGSVGQVLTRSGSTVTWDTPTGGTTNTGSLLTTASVSLNTITFTKGDASTFAITVDTGSGGGGSTPTGSFATTGSNVFSGSQTFNTASLYLNSSGSGTLFSNFTQSVSGTGAYGNILLFPTSVQSGSVILSGSRNIGTINPVTNAGSLTLRGGGNLNGNIGNINTSYSTASSPIVLNNNFLAGAAQNSINNTSSIVTLGANFVGGTVLVTGSATSNVNITQNNIDAAIITNDFTGSGASQNVSVLANLIKGGLTQPSFAQIKFAATQSNGNSRIFQNNIMFGPTNIVSLEASGAVSTTSNLVNTAIIGSNLIVSGTMASNSTAAAMFVGQFNQTGSLADPSQIKFAVGAGDSSNRRTVFFVSSSFSVFVNPGGAQQRGITQLGGDRGRLFDGVTNGSGSTAAEGIYTFATDNVTSTGAQGKVGVVIASSNSNLQQPIYSAILADRTGVTLSNTTSSVALGRDTAYTVSGSYTLYTQNVDISGSVRVNGNLQYNFGEFFSTASVTPSAGVSQSVVFDTTVDTNNVAISGSGALIKVTNAGTYNIQFSIQVNTSAGADTLYVWYKKNGTNITNSASKAVLANNTAQLMTVNIIDSAAANDYYEVAYQTANGNAQILAEAASGNIPAIPSVILTVTQVR